VDLNWEPPAHWSKIETIEMHTGGEPLRVIAQGLPPIEGSTVLEKRRYFRDHYDHLRTGLMWEPRGHADMYGAVMTPSREADYDVFFLHNEGYSTMCGHAIIALTKLVFEAGLKDSNSGSALTFSVPAGIIRARPRWLNGRVHTSYFRGVPSFLYLRDKQVDVPGIGLVTFDVAYGGAFYAFVEAEPLGLVLDSSHYAKLIDYGRRIKHAVTEKYPIEHPYEPDLSFLYGTIVTGPAKEAGHHSRNVCIFADGEVDRSPTGSGVSARAALHLAKGELRKGEVITIESLIGTTMTVEVLETTTFGPHEAVVPEVGGTAAIIGRNLFYIDPLDPLSQGFLLR
jgi:trans-L-3-hydroxyproline dehydratase